MSIKILHFADAHIDAYTGGRIDPKNGFSYHTNDFLKALDEIVDTAIAEQVRLVLFAGDTYRNASPVPTFQREWHRRVIRLAQAKIPMLMIPGNHDISNNTLKASALQELDTLRVPYLHLAAGGVHLYTPQELDGVPVQVLAVPWLPLSLLAARDKDNKKTPEERAREMEEELIRRIRRGMEQADPALPLILLTHYSVQGSKYPSGQTAELGRDVTLSRSLVCDPAFSYTALGHIHLFQDLNEGQQPPVVYPGSIERVDYGEAKEKKGFIIAEVENHHTEYSFRELHTRRMYNLQYEAKDAETIQENLLAMLPSPEDAQDAMIRLTITYPHEFESKIIERELRKQVEGALDFQLKRKPLYENRMRIQSKNISSLTPKDLLTTYCQVTKTSETETEALCSLAEEIFRETETALQKDF
ncbi:MAG: exonuclease SbcCD subunit D [Flexilinea sp.]|nr:exonuclease SbcCD subunit D [Flexilinea sp.]